jgi:hypothetical protein
MYKRHVFSILGFSSAAFLLAVAAALATTTAGLGPIADGTYLSWLPSPATSTDHYVLVDDFKPCNGNTDYVYTSSSTNKDSYFVSLSTVPVTSTINTIMLGTCASSLLSTGTTSSIRLFYRWNGVDVFASSTYVLSTSTLPVVLSPTTTFSGLSLPMSASSTLEIGVEFISGTRGAKVSAMRAQLTY